MLSRRRLSPPAVLVFVLVASISPSPAGAQMWLGGETVGPSGVLNGHSATSLALDGAENPCAAYYEGNDGDLKFAQHTGGTWSITTVDTTGDTGQYCALAIDALGEPHIAYYFKLNPNGTSADHLKYAWRSGGTWNIDTVVAGDVAGFTDLVLDSSGNPHITFFDGFSLSLKHAVKNGSWSVETVDSAGDVGQHASLVIDASDDLHVAYQDATNMGIRYAVKSGGSWATQNVAGFTTFPPFAFTAVHISLVLDSSGYAHIVFRDESSGKSQYSRNTSGSWFTDIARSLGQDLRGSFHSLQMAAGDVPTMAFFDNNWQDVRLAPFDGSWWVPKPIRPDGVSTSLVLDSFGHAHVAYHVPTVSEVQYSFESDVLSDTGSGGWDTRVSLAVSPNPVVTATTLILRTPMALRLGMEILDARGRLVRRLESRSHEPGFNYVTWDGRDNAGKAVGAGVYFAVSRPGNLFQPSKIVVVR